MAPLRKSECILHTSLLTSVILTAKADFRENDKSLNIKHWIYL
jgi:hypothetical protein